MRHRGPRPDDHPTKRDSHLNLARCLLAVAAVCERHGFPHGATANQIAQECGYQPHDAREGRSGRGEGSRVMSPAVHVTPQIAALRNRGLVDWAPRRDGRSGTAVGLSADGEDLLERAEYDQDQVRLFLIIEGEAQRRRTAERQLRARSR